MENRDDWDRHWSDYDLTARSNPAQAFRRELMLRWLKRRVVAVHGRLLDIGSGQGDLIVSLVPLFPTLEVAGVEMSSVGITQSAAKAPSARFYQRDLQVAPSPDDPLHQWATLAVCSEVLEHVDEPDKVLTHASRFLAPGSRLFITVPGGPVSAFDRHIGHRRHFDQTSLKRVILAAGLVPERVTGVGFPFFNLYRLTVILRGEALIRDACGAEERSLSPSAKIAMAAFSLVLKQRLNAGFAGWQMTAEARKPA